MEYCTVNLEILDAIKFWKNMYVKLEQFEEDLDPEFYEKGRKLLKQRIKALEESV